MKILITGAGFNNSGAQAMMLCTVEEFITRFPDADIWVANASSIPNEFENQINFKYCSLSNSEFFYVANVLDKVKVIIKAIAKRILRGEKVDCLSFTKIMKNVDVVIDISGFALGDQWSDENCLSFLARIVASKKHSIPVFLMPQSIGPFEFSGTHRKQILNILNECLDYPSIIFTREEEGYHLLVDNYKLKNVLYSSDLVLQSSVIYKNALKNEDELSRNLSQYNISDGVAIIPNIHCFAFDNGLLLLLYRDIINRILKTNEHVYLIKHSKADTKVCQQIKEMFPDDNVVLINDEMNCILFMNLIKKFKYIIGSRYHSIVHAYKNNVPCIALGWATKYKELLDIFHQGRYVNDIRTLQNSEQILLQIDYLENHIIEEKEIIQEALAIVQKNNCFDLVETYIRKAVKAEG